MPCLLAPCCPVLGRASLVGYRVGYRASLDCRAIVGLLGDRFRTKKSPDKLIPIGAILIGLLVSSLVVCMIGKRNQAIPTHVTWFE